MKLPLFIYRPRSVQALMLTDLHPHLQVAKGNEDGAKPASQSIRNLFKAILELRTFSWTCSKLQWRRWCMIFLQNMQVQKLTDIILTSDMKNCLWVFVAESCYLQDKNNSIKNNNKTKLARNFSWRGPVFSFIAGTLRTQKENKFPPTQCAWFLSSSC